MERAEIIKAVAGIIRQHLPATYRIFLFGSWAEGRALDTSDLDIGIFGATEVPWEAMSRIKAAAAGLPTLRSIDIVDLQSVGADFRRNVLAGAQELSAVNV